MTDIWDQLEEIDDGKSSDRFDHIRDQLPPNAPDGHVYEAYCAEAKQRIANYKSHTHMTRWWLKSSGALLEIAGFCPHIYNDLLVHYVARLDELLNPKPAEPAEPAEPEKGYWDGV